MDFWREKGLRNVQNLEISGVLFDISTNSFFIRLYLTIKDPASGLPCQSMTLEGEKEMGYLS